MWSLADVASSFSIASALSILFRQLIASSIGFVAWLLNLGSPRNPNEIVTALSVASYGDGGASHIHGGMSSRSLDSDAGDFVFSTHQAGAYSHRPSPAPIALPRDSRKSTMGQSSLSYPGRKQSRSMGSFQGSDRVPSGDLGSGSGSESYVGKDEDAGEGPAGSAMSTSAGARAMPQVAGGSVHVILK